MKTPRPSNWPTCGPISTWPRRAVDRLEATDGVAGVAQRDAKKALQEADQPAAAPRRRRSAAACEATRATKVAVEAVAAVGGFAMPRPACGLRTSIARSTATRKSSRRAVQNAGNETLYKRGKLWIANNAKNIDPEKDDAKIKRVKRFSDEYFALVRDNTPAENAVLASQQEGEELLVVLRGQAYRIE